MLPDSHIIIFDGLCNFCSRSTQFILKNDKRATFRFAPVQSAEGSALLRKHGLDPTNVESFLLVKNDAVFLKSDAALEIAAELGLPWSLLTVFRVLPGKWRDAAYDLLARNRYRWFGRRENCFIPTPEQRSRFVLSQGQYGEVQRGSPSTPAVVNGEALGSKSS
jgi:predicted DCC family thiol-disulfide oxidoreductase YuxK